MLRETDMVVLTADLPAHGREPGDLGTVVLVHGSVGYDETVAVASLAADQVRPIGQREIAHVRSINAMPR